VFNLEAMRPDHLELFCACYENNFRRVPALYRDNQRAGGVGWPKRMLVQLLGKAEVRMWRDRLARIGQYVASQAEQRQRMSFDRLKA
jgi:hypothetical protein